MKTARGGQHADQAPALVARRMPEAYADRDDAGEQGNLQEPRVLGGDRLRPRTPGGCRPGSPGRQPRRATASRAPPPDRGPAPTPRPRRTGDRAAVRRGSASAAWAGDRRAAAAERPVPAGPPRPRRGRSPTRPRRHRSGARPPPTRCPARRPRSPHRRRASASRAGWGRLAATRAPGRAQKTGSTTSLPGVSSREVQRASSATAIVTTPRQPASTGQVRAGT